MRFLLLMLLTCSLSTITFSQVHQQALPTVIEASQHSALLEQLSSTYRASLFSASDTNFVQTVQNWRLFLVSMEEYAEEINFDLKGIKVWLKIFWAKDGTIDHIAYILSDRSINIAPTDWEAFLRSFMRNRKIAVSHQRRFSYDSRVFFPLTYRNHKKTAPPPKG